MCTDWWPSCSPPTAWALQRASGPFLLVLALPLLGIARLLPAQGAGLWLRLEHGAGWCVDQEKIRFQIRQSLKIGNDALHLKDRYKQRHFRHHLYKLLT